MRGIRLPLTNPLLPGEKGSSKPALAGFIWHWGTPRQDPGVGNCSGQLGDGRVPPSWGTLLGQLRGGFEAPSPAAPLPAHDTAAFTAQLPPAIATPGALYQDYPPQPRWIARFDTSYRAGIR